MTRTVAKRGQHTLKHTKNGLSTKEDLNRYSC